MLQQAGSFSPEEGDVPELVERDQRSTPAIHSVPGSSSQPFRGGGSVPTQRIAFDDLNAMPEDERRAMLRTIEAKDNAMLAVMRREAAVSRKMLLVAHRAMTDRIREHERCMDAQRESFESQDELFKLKLRQDTGPHGEAPTRVRLDPVLAEHNTLLRARVDELNGDVKTLTRSAAENLNAMIENPARVDPKVLQATRHLERGASRTKAVLGKMKDTVQMWRDSFSAEIRIASAQVQRVVTNHDDAIRAVAGKELRPDDRNLLAGLERKLSEVYQYLWKQRELFAGASDVIALLRELRGVAAPARASEAQKLLELRPSNLNSAVRVFSSLAVALQIIMGQPDDGYGSSAQDDGGEAGELRKLQPPKSEPAVFDALRAEIAELRAKVTSQERSFAAQVAATREEIESDFKERLEREARAAESAKHTIAQLQKQLLDARKRVVELEQGTGAARSGAASSDTVFTSSTMLDDAASPAAPASPREGPSKKTSKVGKSGKSGGKSRAGQSTEGLHQLEVLGLRESTNRYQLVAEFNETRLRLVQLMHLCTPVNASATPVVTSDGGAIAVSRVSTTTAITQTYPEDFGGDEAAPVTAAGDSAAAAPICHEVSTQTEVERELVGVSLSQIPVDVETGRAPGGSDAVDETRDSRDLGGSSAADGSRATGYFRPLMHDIDTQYEPDRADRGIQVTEQKPVMLPIGLQVDPPSTSDKGLQTREDPQLRLLRERLAEMERKHKYALREAEDAVDDLQERLAETTAAVASASARSGSDVIGDSAAATPTQTPSGAETPIATEDRVSGIAAPADERPAPSGDTLGATTATAPVMVHNCTQCELLTPTSNVGVNPGVVEPSAPQHAPMPTVMATETPPSAASLASSAAAPPPAPPSSDAPAIGQAASTPPSSAAASIPEPTPPQLPSREGDTRRLDEPAQVHHDVPETTPAASIAPATSSADACAQCEILHLAMLQQPADATEVGAQTSRPTSSPRSMADAAVQSLEDTATLVDASTSASPIAVDVALDAAYLVQLMDAGVECRAEVAERADACSQSEQVVESIATQCNFAALATRRTSSDAALAARRTSASDESTTMERRSSLPAAVDAVGPAAQRPVQLESASIQTDLVPLGTPAVVTCDAATDAPAAAADVQLVTPAVLAPSGPLPDAPSFAASTAPLTSETAMQTSPADIAEVASQVDFVVPTPPQSRIGTASSAGRVEPLCCTTDTQTERPHSPQHVGAQVGSSPQGCVEAAVQVALQPGSTTMMVAAPVDAAAVTPMPTDLVRRGSDDARTMSIGHDAERGAARGALRQGAAHQVEALHGVGGDDAHHATATPPPAPIVPMMTASDDGAAATPPERRTQSARQCADFAVQVEITTAQVRVSSPTARALPTTESGRADDAGRVVDNVTTVSMHGTSTQTLRPGSPHHAACQVELATAVRASRTPQRTQQLPNRRTRESASLVAEAATTSTISAAGPVAVEQDAPRSDVRESTDPELPDPPRIDHVPVVSTNDLANELVDTDDLIVLWTQGSQTDEPWPAFTPTISEPAAPTRDGASPSPTLSPAAATASSMVPMMPPSANVEHADSTTAQATPAEECEECNELKSRLLSDSMTVLSLRDRVHELEGAVDAAKAELRHFEAEHADVVELSKRADSLRQRCEALTGEVSSLQRQCSASQAATSSSLAEFSHATLHQKMQTASFVEGLFVSLHELRAGLLDVQTKFESSHHAHTELQTLFNSLENDHSQLRGKFSDTSRELESEVQRVKQLTSDVQKRDSRIVQLDEHAQSSIAALQSAKAVAKAEADTALKAKEAEWKASEEMVARTRARLVDVELKLAEVPDPTAIVKQEVHRATADLKAQVSVLQRTKTELLRQMKKYHAPVPESVATAAEEASASDQSLAEMAKAAEELRLAHETLQAQHDVLRRDARTRLEALQQERDDLQQQLLRCEGRLADLSEDGQKFVHLSRAELIDALVALDSTPSKQLLLRAAQLQHDFEQLETEHKALLAARASAGNSATSKSPPPAHRSNSPAPDPRATVGAAHSLPPPAVVARSADDDVLNDGDTAPQRATSPVTASAQNNTHGAADAEGSRTPQPEVTAPATPQQAAAHQTPGSNSRQVPSVPAPNGAPTATAGLGLDAWADAAPLFMPLKAITVGPRRLLPREVLTRATFDAATCRAGDWGPLVATLMCCWGSCGSFAIAPPAELEPLARAVAAEVPSGKYMNERTAARAVHTAFLIIDASRAHFSRESAATLLLCAAMVHTYSGGPLAVSATTREWLALFGVGGGAASGSWCDAQCVACHGLLAKHAPTLFPNAVPVLRHVGTVKSVENADTVVSVTAMLRWIPHWHARHAFADAPQGTVDDALGFEASSETVTQALSAWPSTVQHSLDRVGDLLPKHIRERMLSHATGDAPTPTVRTSNHDGFDSLSAPYNARRLLRLIGDVPTDQCVQANVHVPLTLAERIARGAPDGEDDDDVDDELRTPREMHADMMASPTRMAPISEARVVRLETEVSRLRSKLAEATAPLPAVKAHGPRPKIVVRPRNDLPAMGDEAKAHTPEPKRQDRLPPITRTTSGPPAPDVIAGPRLQRLPPGQRMPRLRPDAQASPSKWDAAFK